jgi:hypothetical protein
MPAVVIERASLPTEMRDALKKHILRERQRKKEEADANEADKQRRREEKAKALSSSKVQLEDNAKDILQLERTITDLQQQKAEQYNLLKRALTEEDRRKHSQQTVTKEPSWTSLYSPSKTKNFVCIYNFEFFKIFKWLHMLIILNIIYQLNHLIVY